MIHDLQQDIQVAADQLLAPQLRHEPDFIYLQSGRVGDFFEVEGIKLRCAFGHGGDDPLVIDGGGIYVEVQET